ncbi:hypothetical protein ABIB85_008514 [Bradyrhizobium sp. JR1.5]
MKPSQAPASNHSYMRSATAPGVPVNPLVVLPAP